MMAAGPAPAPATAKKRRMSAAGRRRIALAQKKRWAALKADQKRKQAPAAQTQPKKRVISAAGRARIVAATKKRWAAWRKAHKAQVFWFGTEASHRRKLNTAPVAVAAASRVDGSVPGSGRTTPTT